MTASRRATIRDVAEQAGVSVATVSKVINQRYGVAQSTLARVQQVIDELGFQSSIVASSLRSHRTNVLGILVADLEPFSTELLKGAARAVRETGYELVVYSAGRRTADRVGWERRYLGRLAGTLIDGAILVTPTEVGAPVGIPVVAVDPHAGDSRVPTVASENLRGAQLATDHLIALGHRSIGFIAGRADLESARLRQEGYELALTAAGIAPDPGMVAVGDFLQDRAHEAARDLLDRPDRPTAVFAANDSSALGVLALADELGIEVPSGLSIIGFDNVPESVMAVPQLTTVEQPIQLMGERAVELLLDLLAGRTDVDNVTLPTKLISRQTTAPPAGHTSKAPRRVASVGDPPRPTRPARAKRKGTRR